MPLILCRMHFLSVLLVILGSSGLQSALQKSKQAPKMISRARNLTVNLKHFLSSFHYMCTVQKHLRSTQNTSFESHLIIWYELYLIY